MSRVLSSVSYYYYHQFESPNTEAPQIRETGETGKTEDQDKQCIVHIRPGEGVGPTLLFFILIHPLSPVCSPALFPDCKILLVRTMHG